MIKLPYPKSPILLVDDEQNYINSVEMTLAGNGYNNSINCLDSRKVLKLLSKTQVSLILMDLTMPHISGEELVPLISKEFPNIPIIVVSAINNLETAVNCMKNGAYDYILKPINRERLLTSVKNAIDFFSVREENELLKQHVLSGKLEHPEAFTNIITKSNSMHSIFQYLEAISASNLPVTITGETGTGKELIANAVHNISGRKGKFVAVNVGGLDSTLFSDTLFGHKKGAFSGAETNRLGMIEEASGGTLFLDEIGDLNMESQIKLLRLLQEGKYYPLGSDIAKISTARIIVATHKNLKELEEKDIFRKDLYYRLQYHHIHIPPLRDRKEDIQLLVNHFLGKICKELEKPVPQIPTELNLILQNYSFPGNIRELESMVFDAAGREKNAILSTKSFRDKIKSVSTGTSKEFAEKSEIIIKESGVAFSEILPNLKDMEQLLISEALQRANGNQTLAADFLGMTRQALNNRLQRAKNK